MKEDWFHSILVYLNSKPFNNTSINLNSFFINELEIDEEDYKTTVRLRQVLDDLKSRRLLIWKDNIPPKGQDFGIEFSTAENVFGAIKYHEIIATLLFDGKMYIENWERDHILKKQAESAIKTNLSIRETNTITKDWIRQQKFFTKVIMWATVVTAISAGIAAFKEIKTLYNNQSQEIIKPQVKVIDTSSLLHQIKVEKKLDSNQITSDTILHKK